MSIWSFIRFSIDGWIFSRRDLAIYLQTCPNFSLHNFKPKLPLQMSQISSNNFFPMIFISRLRNIRSFRRKKKKKMGARGEKKDMRSWSDQRTSPDYSRRNPLVISPLAVRRSMVWTRWVRKIGSQDSLTSVLRRTGVKAGSFLCIWHLSDLDRPLDDDPDAMPSRWHTRRNRER